MISTGLQHSHDCLKGILTAPVQHKKLFFVVTLLLLFYTFTGKNVKSIQFDYFILSQRWLPTACIEYTEHSFSSEHQHYCILPKAIEVWTIHGFWPTQKSHMGPFFCNRSMPFDFGQIQSIEQDLRSYWPNIEGGKSVESLWQHEWDKHGTCAAQLESLKSEILYFNTTLNFFKTHNVQEVFKRNKITPSLHTGMNVLDLIKIIKSSFGKLPQIHCIEEVKWKQPYLSEIRLCYNKDLELMDCPNLNGKKPDSNLDLTKGLTNCPVNGKIILPDKVNIEHTNKILKNSEKEEYYDMLVNTLGLVRFLQWASI